MSFVFKKAVRERTPLLIGLVGPSGSGKTFSALRLATGIQSVVGGKVVGIDTEARRMLHYADKFEFDHLPFHAPFGSLNYMEAIKAAIEHGAKTIIVDSMSHEHEGIGGHLETHESELTRLAGDDWKKRNAMTFLAWAKPAGNRRKLINYMLQAECNFIFCFRAKEKLKIQRGKDPVELGWQAIAGEEFVFEMLCRCLLLPGSKGVPTWSEEACALGVPKISDGLEKVFSQPGHEALDEWMGKQLARWADGTKGTDKETKTATSQKDSSPEAQKPQAPFDDAIALLDKGDRDGALSMRELLSEEDQAKLDMELATSDTTV